MFNFIYMSKALHITAEMIVDSMNVAVELCTWNSWESSHENTYFFILLPRALQEFASPKALAYEEGEPARHLNK